MENYNIRLNEIGLKATPQRLAILEIIEYRGHINIDDLYEMVKEKFHSISLATIYKNINAMLSKTLLTEVKLPSKKSVYEIVKDSHSHLLCNMCGEVVDIDISIANIENQVSKEYNFDVAKSDLVLNGVCSNCK
jgi:Fur family peroxide stress response transcriptional regulator